MRRIVHLRRMGRSGVARACLAVVLAATALPFGLPASFPAPTQPAPIADSSAALDIAVQEVRDRAAQVQHELPQLDQALAVFAGELTAPTSGSSDPMTAAQVDEARAVLRSHDEDLRRFAVYVATVTHWRDAGEEIERLADLLDAEGDRILRVIAARPARAGAGPDVLATAHTAYRQAMTELVGTARWTRDQIRMVRERERLAGEHSGGRDDPRFRKLLAQFGEGFADAAVYLPSTPPELFRPRERPADTALDVALIWDEPRREWYRVSGSVPVEAIFRDAYIVHGRRPTAELLKTLANNNVQISLRTIKADEFARFLAGAAGDAVLARAVEQSDVDGSARRALHEPWRLRIAYAYDENFHERMLRFFGRLRAQLATNDPAGPALRRLDEIAGRYSLTLADGTAAGALPAVGVVRVESWVADNRKITSVSIWRFEQDRVTIEIDDRQVLGLRSGNVVTAEAPTPRRNCTVKDTRTFEKGGSLTFTAVQSCTRRNGGTRMRDVSGAGTWELLRQPGKASDQEETTTPGRKARGPS